MSCSTNQSCKACSFVALPSMRFNRASSSSAFFWYSSGGNNFSASAIGCKSREAIINGKMLKFNSQWCLNSKAMRKCCSYCWRVVKRKSVYEELPVCTILYIFIPAVMSYYTTAIWYRANGLRRKKQLHSNVRKLKTSLNIWPLSQLFIRLNHIKPSFTLYTNKEKLLLPGSEYFPHTRYNILSKYYWLWYYICFFDDTPLVASCGRLARFGLQQGLVMKYSSANPKAIMCPI